VPFRQLKFDSFGRWGVPIIIDYLPVQLIFALFLFFAGLVYFVWTLNRTVAIITSIWVGISALFFLVTTLLPSFFELCAFCSPQSWFFFYLSKQLQRLYSERPASEVYSFTDTWIDAFTNALSRPSESRTYRTRALNWIHATLGSWESSLVSSLYQCALSLPPRDTAEVICGFWSSASSPGLKIADRQIYVTELWNAIEPEAYWRVYESLLESIQSKKGPSTEDETPITMVFCSLHLMLCQEHSFYDERSQKLVIPGLTLLAEISLGRDLSLPLDTKLSVAATLSHIGAQEKLTLPDLDEASLNSFTEKLLPNSTEQETEAFLSLSLICIRLWCWKIERTQRIDLTCLTKLLTAMQSAVQSGENSVGAAITNWMSFALEEAFIQKIVHEDAKDALGALQELVLCFRKAYDDGIGLDESVVARIDVLIVTICAPAVRSMVSRSGTTNNPCSRLSLRPSLVSLIVERTTLLPSRICVGGQPSSKIIEPESFDFFVTTPRCSIHYLLLVQHRLHTRE
jgi:hypothetical protein